MRRSLKNAVVEWAVRGRWHEWRFVVSRIVFILFNLKNEEASRPAIEYVCPIGSTVTIKRPERYSRELSAKQRTADNFNFDAARERK